MTTASRDEELVNRVASLESNVEDLRSELAENNTLFSLPSPSPAGIIRFTDQIAIPSIILVLETNIQLLKLLQRALRLTATDAPSDTAAEVPNDLSMYLTRTLGELENAIQKLQSLDISAGPTDETAQSLLNEIRSIKAEISDQITHAKSNNDSHETVKLDSRHEQIEEELEAIKDELEEQTSNRSPDDTDE